MAGCGASAAAGANATHRLVRAWTRRRAVALSGCAALRTARARMDRGPQSDNQCVLGDRAARDGCGGAHAGRVQSRSDRHAGADDKRGAQHRSSRRIRDQRQPGRRQIRGKLRPAGWKSYGCELSGNRSRGQTHRAAQGVFGTSRSSPARNTRESTESVRLRRKLSTSSACSFLIFRRRT